MPVISFGMEFVKHFSSDGKCTTVHIKYVFEAEQRK